MNEIVCPLCLSGEVGPYLRRKDGLTVYLCKVCGLGFVLAKELAAEYGPLSALYEKRYYHSGGDTGYSDYDSIPAANFLWQPAFVELIEDIKGKTILDIGCATGRLMECLKKRGAGEVEGVEVSEYASLVARGKGFTVYKGDIAGVDREQGFDMIIAFDVMEHVAELRVFLSKVYSLLMPDGVFIFMTPDAGSADARRQKEGWYGFNSSLEHICYFSVSTLAWALEKTFGSEPVLYQAKAADGQGILGFIRKKPLPKDGKLRDLFAGNFPPGCITPGNVIPVCVLLARLGDDRSREYLEKYRSCMPALADDAHAAFLSSLCDPGSGGNKPDAADSGSREVTIRAYREGDEYGIVKLFNEVFERKMTIEEWRWKYRGQKNAGVHVAVMDHPGDGIVGHYGGIPLRMMYDGKEIKGMAPVDTMVKPKSRSFVRFRKMYHVWEEEAVKDAYRMFYGFSPPHVIKLSVEKLKIYERVGTVYDAFKEVRFNNNLWRFLCKFAPIGFDDRRIDELWARVKEEFRLTVIRDRDYLAWRYERNPLFTYEIWGLTKRWSSGLLALAVFKIEEHETLRVMDLVFSRDVLPALLSKIENAAFRAGRRRVTLWLPLFNDVLEARGYTLVDSGATMPTIAHPAVLKAPEIREKFFYTMGDTDYL